MYFATKTKLIDFATDTRERVVPAVRWAFSNGVYYQVVTEF